MERQESSDRQISQRCRRGEKKGSIRTGEESYCRWDRMRQENRKKKKQMTGERREEGESNMDKTETV